MVRRGYKRRFGLRFSLHQTHHQWAGCVCKRRTDRHSRHLQIQPVPGSHRLRLKRDSLLNGTLRYDAATDLLIYQAKPPRASRTANPQGPVLMSRDNDELKDTILRLVLGATNEEQVTARLRPVLETLRHATNYDDAVVRLRPVLSATTNRVRSMSGATTSQGIQLLEYGTFRKLASTNDVSEPGSLTGARMRFRKWHLSNAPRMFKCALELHSDSV